ncbi:hypothetical protein D3C85_1927300 [compost metagenome]
MLIIVKSPAKTVPIIGPMYGIIFSIAHRKAITKAFLFPKIIKTIKYKIKTTVN